ncbi:pentapeptide repeat-containing protein [Kordia sp. YSTF-M3]|uniref:Pentapeptide repeat-containing protein n=1 Tax=Kordia aestuariivivens TaxID=2759037 RepID=A0ABR7QD19_9FLAO|nr:pentapeptide repeat-containing protein [Kordia aestuariivivens]MBC8756388.1 pentapeptide repeat-containing protein [Kordia aestuariivivens]
MITKETYDWVKKLLDPKITELSDDDYDKLVKDYFRKDKTDWYREVDDRKKWDIEKVEQFWFLIGKYVFPEGDKHQFYNFSEFIFPKLINAFSISTYVFLRDARHKNFWMDLSHKVIPFEISLKSAKFLDDLNFYNIEFAKDIDFKNVQFHGEFYTSLKCKFSGNVKFTNAVFYKNVFMPRIIKGNANFYQTNFHNLANFINTEFQSEVVFENAIFKKDAYFNGCKFNESVNFEGADFSQLTLFIDTEFEKKVSFSDAEFKGDTNFYRTLFSDTASFDNSIFLEAKKIYFLDLKGNPLNLSFKNTIFSKSILFRRIDFTNTTFLESDLTDVKFRECEWGENYRIVLQDEKDIGKEEKDKL